MPAPDYVLEIAALNTALGAGELTVESDGDRVTYQSFEEIRKRIAYFRDLAASSSAPAGSSPRFGVTVAGFCRD
jgi:hypothetical protein